MRKRKVKLRGRSPEHAPTAPSGLVTWTFRAADRARGSIVLKVRPKTLANLELCR